MLEAIPISELAQLVGVPAYRIAYALTNKRLPAPQMIAGRRLWKPEDVVVVKAYFDAKAGQTRTGRPPQDVAGKPETTPS